jgi:carboxymethylenebutenolidase
MPESTSETITTSTITLSVSDGTAMPAYVARPKEGSGHAGILVFQEAFGVNGHIRDVTERFARAGYVAVAPSLFHRTAPPDFEGSYTDFGSVMPHMQALTDDGQTADVQAAYAWLTSPDGGAASAVGTVGYCMGGRTSFLADSVLPVQACASYYGGGIAPGPRGPGLLSRAVDLHAPILLIWGGKDAHIPIEAVRAVEDAVIAAGKTYEQVIFSQADHAFFCDARSAYNPEASRQAWPLTLAFFETYLH